MMHVTPQASIKAFVLGVFVIKAFVQLYQFSKYAVRELEDKIWATTTHTVVWLEDAASSYYI